MSSPYDALLEEPKKASPYDALLSKAPSPYDALLAKPLPTAGSIDSKALVSGADSTGIMTALPSYMTTESAQKLIERSKAIQALAFKIPLPEPKGEGIGAQFTREVENIAGQAIAPAGLAGLAITGGIGQVAPLVERGIAAGFSLLGAEQAYQKWKQGDKGGAVADMAGGALAGVHAANPEITPSLFRRADAVTPEQRSQAFSEIENYLASRKATAAGLPNTAEALANPPPSLTPALKVGDQIVKGNSGDRHADIMSRESSSQPEKAASTIDAFGKDENHVFVDHQGNVLDRDQGGQFADIHGLRDPSLAGTPLHSEHLNETAQAKTETPPQSSAPAGGQPPAGAGRQESSAGGTPVVHGLEDISARTGKAVDPSKPEQVLAPAVRSKDGQVAVGAIHAEAAGNLPEGTDMTGETDLFYTTHGRLVTRAEAAELKGVSGELHSSTAARPATPPETGIRDGLRPAADIIAESHVPKVAEQMTPQAMGIVHPLPGFLQNVADYFSNNSPSQIGNRLKGMLKTSAGETIPNTTIVDRQSGELGARWLSSKIAAPFLAQTHSASVLEGTSVDPVKLGAALTEDNLRSVKQSFMDQEQEAMSKGDEKAAQEARDKTDRVASIIGGKNSPFKTTKEYQDFLNEPSTKAAIEKHRVLWEQVIDPMYRRAMILDPDQELPSRGQQTDARINLHAIQPGEEGPKVTTATAGNPLNTLRKKSPFGLQAQGTGTNYDIDYHSIIANTYGRQLEIANKNAFEQRLIDTHNAVIDKPGQQVVFPDGEQAKAFPLKRGNQNQSLYVRQSLASEYRRASNVDLVDVPPQLKTFSAVLNRSALAGLTDASVHVQNLMTALFTRPSVAGTALQDSLMSSFGRLDVPVILGKTLIKAFKNNQTQVSELAEIGAMRTPHATEAGWRTKFIESADRTTRLVLDDAYKSMVKQGLVEDTETSRREFVNQVGQYNKRAQTQLVRWVRDLGFSPFITAGKTFNTLGVRFATMSPGVEASNGMAAAALRANVLSKWLGGMVFIGTANYLLTKDKGGGMLGRPGVPLGNVDTGMTDKNGRPLSIPVGTMLGMNRALRVTGVRGAVQAARSGLPPSDVMDSARRDIVNAAISPWVGPIPRFGFEASGIGMPGVGIPRSTPLAAPNQSQAVADFEQAIIDANPIIKSGYVANKPGGTWADAVQQQIPRLSLNPSNPADMMANYPEIVHKAKATEFIGDVVGRARKLEVGTARDAYITSQLAKLTPEDREEAARQLKYRRVKWSGSGETVPRRKKTLFP